MSLQYERECLDADPPRHASSYGKSECIHSVGDDGHVRHAESGIPNVPQGDEETATRRTRGSL